MDTAEPVRVDQCPPAWGWPFLLGDLPLSVFKKDPTSNTTQGDRKHPKWFWHRLCGMGAQNLSRLTEKETGCSLHLSLLPEIQTHSNEELETLPNKPQSHCSGLKVNTAISAAVVASSCSSLHLSHALVWGTHPSSGLRDFGTFQTYLKRHEASGCTVSSPPSAVCSSPSVCVPQLSQVSHTCSNLPRFMP